MLREALYRRRTKRVFYGPTRLAVVVGLREGGLRLCGLDLGGHLRRLLALDRTVDDCEHLAGAHPTARIHQDADHSAARAGNADRTIGGSLRD